MIKKILKISLIAVLWLGLWQVLAMIVDQELLLPTPVTVAKRLLEMSLTASFYRIIARSLIRMLAGIIAGTAVGILGGSLTAFSRTARDIFAPLLAAIKATPVASFIILLVLYVSRDSAPLIIALMMVSPIVWTGVEAGILNTDKELLEMSDAYKMSTLSKIKHLYIPSATPYFLASLRSSLGMAWKAGIAAEVLLGPIISIGKMIAEAKTNLETANLFAWTVVVVIVSVIIERSMVFILNKALKSRSFESKGGVNLG